jgi:hypothetical protein
MVFVEEVPDGLRQSLPVQGQRGLDLTTGCCAITHGERTQRSFKQARRLRHRLPREREIAAATRTDSRFGQARLDTPGNDQRSGIEVVQEVGKCIHRRSSGRRPVRRPVLDSLDAVHQILGVFSARAGQQTLGLLDQGAGFDAQASAVVGR